MTGSLGLAVVAALLALGLVLVLAGRGLRRPLGLGEGRTVALDSVTLTSRRLGLAGRPDRLVRRDGTIIVEEWKGGRRLRDGHKAQLGVYFLLVEEQYKVRPPYGVVVLGDGTRHRVENSERLRAWVLELAEAIRAKRAAADQPIAVHATPGQCRACGMRGHCSQARA
jgi:CRISPR-associated exonuclease Cas4